MGTTRQLERGTDGRRRGRRGPSVLTVLGVVLLAAGLACFGWVGYQYVGTDIVSRQAFDDERAALRQSWAGSAGAEQQPPPGAGRSTTVEDRSGTGVPGTAIALLRVPAFGADYEVPVLRGVDDRTLARGIGHYPGTAAPGEVGNFVIAGHRITHGQPFARLLELDRGDEVVVETAAAVHTYVVDLPPRELTVPDTDTSVLQPVPRQPGAEPTERVLTLTTCQDLFRSPDRSVGFATLRSTVDKS